MRKNFIVLTATLCIFFGLFVYFDIFNTPAPGATVSPTSRPRLEVQGEALKQRVAQNNGIPLTPQESEEAASNVSTYSALASNVTFKVGGETYRTHIDQAETVLDAMRLLASTTSFSFTGREYPSLGFFIESIDGKKNADGSYWFLYVNGTYASRGASQTTLVPGDTVLWRYEKNY